MLKYSNNSSRDHSVTVEWFAIQPLFQKAKADMMFLLDCCAAASAASVSSSSTTATTETIAACGFETSTPEPGPHSFTNTLIDVLSSWSDRAPFSVAMLHSKVLAQLQHERPQKDCFGKKIERRTPVYIVTTSNIKARSIEL